MMDWVNIILGIISPIFSLGLYKLANDNLNDLKIPDNFDSFNDGYTFKLDKIKANNQENLSKYLDDIVNQSNNQVDENSLNSIDVQELFFSGIEQDILFKSYGVDIKYLYDMLIDKKKKINNLFTYLFLLSVVPIILWVIYNLFSVVFYNEFFLSITIMIILYVIFEIIRTWKEFNHIIFRIDKIINEINKTYNMIPHWFGDKYGN